MIFLSIFRYFIFGPSSSSIALLNKSGQLRPKQKPTPVGFELAGVRESGLQNWYHFRGPPAGGAALMCPPQHFPLVTTDIIF